MIKLQRTPFKTVHMTGTDNDSREGGLKSAMTRTAKSAGLGKRISRRSHVIGGRVTVFDIYRKA